MKLKIVTLKMLLLISIFGKANPQPVAVLPSYLNYGENTLKTICVDYFKETPTKGIKYNQVLKGSPSDLNMLGSQASFVAYKGSSEFVLRGTSSRNLSIKNPVIIGQENAYISDDYYNFIESCVRGCQRGSIRFDQTAHEELQIKVWTYNVLDVLGYINHQTLGPTIQFEKGLNLFMNDFGINSLGLNSNETYVEIISQVEFLKNIKESDELTNHYFKTLVVSKSKNGEYIVYRGTKRLFSTYSETIFSLNIINQFRNNDRVNLSFNNFASIEKEEAFLSTIRIKLNQNNSKIILNPDIISTYEVALMFAPIKNLQLSNNLSASDIVKVNFGNRTYYTVDFNMSSKFLPIYTEIEASSNQKTVLTKLISSLNQVFSTNASDQTAIAFLNSFKKDIMKINGINDDTEFQINVKIQFEDFRIVKYQDDENIYVLRN